MSESRTAGRETRVRALATGMMPSTVPLLEASTRPA